MHLPRHGERRRHRTGPRPGASVGQTWAACPLSPAGWLWSRVPPCHDNRLLAYLGGLRYKRVDGLGARHGWQQCLLCETTPAHPWHSGHGLAPSSFLLRPAPCPGARSWEPWPEPRVGARWLKAGPRGGLPSLDVHLIRRGAILHLALGGGACGAEKHRSMAVRREERPERQTGALPAPALLVLRDAPLISGPPAPHPISSSQLAPFFPSCGSHLSVHQTATFPTWSKSILLAPDSSPSLSTAPALSASSLPPPPQPSKTTVGLALPNPVDPFIPHLEQKYDPTAGRRQSLGLAPGLSEL